MGVYYKMVCDARKELIDPGDINDDGMKHYAIAYPTHPFGPLCIFAMVGRWSGQLCRILSDASGGDEYYDYTDVTEILIKDYNAYYAPDKKDAHEVPIVPLRWTGCRESES